MKWKVNLILGGLRSFDWYRTYHLGNYKWRWYAILVAKWHLCLNPYGYCEISQVDE